MDRHGTSAAPASAGDPESGHSRRRERSPRRRPQDRRRRADGAAPSPLRPRPRHRRGSRSRAARAARRSARRSARSRAGAPVRPTSTRTATGTFSDGSLSTIPRPTRAPVSCCTRCAARSAARRGRSPPIPFSWRMRASERRPSRRAVLRIVGPWKTADSRMTLVVELADLGRGAAHDPGEPDRPLAIGDHQHALVELRARGGRAFRASRPRAHGAPRSRRRGQPPRRTRAAAVRARASRSSSRRRSR